MPTIGSKGLFPNPPFLLSNEMETADRLPHALRTLRTLHFTRPPLTRLTLVPQLFSPQPTLPRRGVLLTRTQVAGFQEPSRGSRAGPAPGAPRAERHSQLPPVDPCHGAPNTGKRAGDNFPPEVCPVVQDGLA